MAVTSSVSSLGCLPASSSDVFMVINAHSRLTTCNSTSMLLYAGMYRHLQARLRSNAESVAFYGGIEKEGKIIVARFKELLRHHSRLLTKQWQFGMVQVSTVALCTFCLSTSLCSPIVLLKFRANLLVFLSCWLPVGDA